MRTPHPRPGSSPRHHPAPRGLRPACLAGLLFAALSLGASAQSLQDLTAIQQAALTALQAGPGTQAMVAPGLRLAACRQPLVAVPSTPTVADVRCPDAPGWRLFVPVRNAPAAAAAGPSAAGAPADGGAPAVIVKRGDPVVLRARIGNSEIRMGGRALGQAMAGNVVNVENDSSHRIIRGRLNADGTVDVVN